MRGWLGGACAEPTVVREALKALEEGSPRLLFLGPPEELEGRARDGVVTRADRVPERRSTGGLRGTRPAATAARRDRPLAGRRRARALAAAWAGGPCWSTTARASGARDVDVVTTLDLEAACRRTVVRGRGHAGALRRGRAGARARDARRVRRAWWRPASGPTRCSATCAIAGCPDDALARVHAPAGLDLGHVPTEEIAVAILAEIVQLRAAGQLEAGVAVADGAAATRRSTRSAA